MSVDLGLVATLGADAVGQPGQRRFRLFTRNVRDTAIMWMEKEQLGGLAEALDRSLAYISEGKVLRTEAHVGELEEPTSIPAEFLVHPTYEFQVDHMRLSYNDHNDTFSLRAIPLDIVMEKGREPQVVAREDQSVTFTFTLQQAQQLSSSIIKVISAGRPVCPFCHAPLDGGPHACVKQNGHREIIQIEEGGEEEE